ncbi:OsmC family protein [Rhodococcus aerolatus]
MTVVTETNEPTPAETRLWVERTGTRTCTGRSSRGAEVLVGPVEQDGSFTPGELLKVALAACTSLSTDAPLARRLGDGYAATVEVSGPADRATERYPALAERLVVDLSGLDDAERARLEQVVRRAVDASCTVGRTLTHGTEISLTVG